MSKPKAPRVTLITGEFPIANVQLATPRAYQPGATPKYSISLPLTPADAKPLLEGCKEVARQQFPTANERLQVTKPNGDTVTLKLPFAAGDAINEKRWTEGKTAFDHFAGKLVFRASSMQAVPVCDMGGKPVDPASIHSGDTVRAQVSLVAMETPAFQGVVCYLNAVLLVKRGERRSASDAFASFIGTSSVDPFAAQLDSLLK